MVGIVYLLATLANDDALVAEVSGRIVSFCGTAPSVSASGTSVKVVLAANELLGIVGFLEALRVDVFIEAKIPVGREKKQPR